MISLPKRYNPKTAEPILQNTWHENGVYHFDIESDAPVYSIDTPPPTVSGHLHLGHVYSYSHADFFARFWRMNGRNVFYPMGFDDNGLPTGRLVEGMLGVRAADMDRQAFIEKCLQVSEEAIADYKTLWQRLGLSIDWRYTYRTIGAEARRIAQHSFLTLYQQGLAYRRQAPSIWCPECQTAIAQAELDDMERETTFHTLAFRLENGETLPIATTRPELLAACVAVFVHPEDGRFTQLLGQKVTVPLFGRQVSVMADPGADPQKGTGAVMCCTFGDTADVEWQRLHVLRVIEAIGKDGRLTGAAGVFSGQTIADARQNIVAALQINGELIAQQPLRQALRVHERCDTPVEYIMTRQWFIRLLDAKEEFLAAGAAARWYPPHMQNRFSQWVQNLNWDWCISRQRVFGVPFPIWTCNACDTPLAAELDELPLDPMETQPKRPCPNCGGHQFTPETDMMDTWATSSMSPQIVGQWFTNPKLYEKITPFSLRTQAHEIIRTWAFYSIVKSYYHFGQTPWQDIAISGWGLAPSGTTKLSKSRGGGPIDPMEMIANYSADAVRYWAASTSLGKDALISEEKIQAGAKLVTKLWNVARFSQRFLLNDPTTSVTSYPISGLTPADRWMLARLQQVIAHTTAAYQAYDYLAAKNEVELFFWRDLADNYLEMVKKRLYDNDESSAGARFTLHHVLLTTVKLFAPLLPHVTERIYQGLFATADGSVSVHKTSWPEGNEVWMDATAVSFGSLLIDIAASVRRYKSENNISLGAELAALHLATDDPRLANSLNAAANDLISITRAQKVVVNRKLAAGLIVPETNSKLQIGLQNLRPD